VEKSKTGLLAAVIHELLKTASFETLADLSDAVKVRCAKLKIPYDTAQLTDAARFVARTRPVLVTPPSMPSTPIAPPPQEITGTQAAAILASLGVNIRGGRLRQKRAKPAHPDAPEGFELVEVR